MTNNKLNIYNNLIKLTRNKKFYLKLEQNETFSDRLIILFFHFGFFLKNYKDFISKEESQDIFDFFMRQIELSIREIGYGDVSVNKKMKQYINLFYSIIEKIENWPNLDNISKINILSDFLKIGDDIQYYVDYFEKYRKFLSENTLNQFTKDILNLKI
tara:strand:- start:1752 stop:2225 length:474 start_codon:yes stop_codon:yes gene_type:complete